jgi:hypothetical protein
MIRLEKPPEFVIRYPQCSACDVDLDHDGDMWTCPKCGTTWPHDANDGDLGELREFDEDEPVVPNAKAHMHPWIEHAFQPLFPDIVPQTRLSTCRCYSPRWAHTGEGVR